MNTPSLDREKALLRLARLARLLDASWGIPGTRWRFGLDSLLGLVPGVGDAAGIALSGYIVWRASQLGIPGRTLARMVANIGIDALVGTVPVLGDLFDVTFKANMRNLRLLETHLGAPFPAAQDQGDWRQNRAEGMPRSAHT